MRKSADFKGNSALLLLYKSFIHINTVERIQRHILKRTPFRGDPLIGVQNKDLSNRFGTQHFEERRYSRELFSDINLLTTRIIVHKRSNEL